MADKTKKSKKVCSYEVEEYRIQSKNGGRFTQNNFHGSNIASSDI